MSGRGGTLKHDVLVTRGARSLDALPESPVIATGSPRRAAELLRARPDATIAPLRGNVDTRIRKLRENTDWDAIVLASAGIARLGPDLSGLCAVALPFEQMLPAPGQGALGVQVRADDAEALAMTRVPGDAPGRWGREAWG